MNAGQARPTGPILLAVALVAATLIAAVASDGASRRRTRAAGKTRGSADSAQVLVRIGRETITRGGVERRLASMPEQFRANYSTPDGRKQLLERMVEEQVWLAMAVKRGIPGRPAVREQLEQQRRDLLVRTAVNEVMATNPAPSDSEAHAYYDAHATEYRVPATLTVRHIQTKTRADAERAKNWALKKRDWADLVKRFSTDTLSRNSGGSLGSVTREGVFASLGSQPALAESAFALSEGAIGGPYHTDRGWHVLKIDAKKPESVRPFDQVRQVILRQIGMQRSQDYYQARLAEARAALKVSADSSAIERFVSQKKSAREQFNDAQALGPAQDRIDAYNKLLAEYPDSDVSPQAQFMVGFIYSEELKNYDQSEKAFRQLLQRYPKAELAPSARWMIDHMRTEETPNFIDLSSDSTAHPSAAPPQSKGMTVKP